MNRSVLSPLRASRRSGAVPIRAVLCYVGRACAAATLALLVSSPVSADEPPFTLAEAKQVQTPVELRRDSALAWLNRYYAEAADRTVLQQLEAVRLEVTAADAAYRGGHGTAADVLTARQAFAEFEDLASESSREVSAAKLALDRWVPGASDHALVGNPAIDAIPLHKHGLDAQLARHPEILALERP